MGNLYFDTIWNAPISRIWPAIREAMKEREAAYGLALLQQPFVTGEYDGFTGSHLPYADDEVEGFFFRQRGQDGVAYIVSRKDRPIAWHFEATGWYLPQFNSKHINRKREVRALAKFFRANGVEYTLGTPFYTPKKIRK